MQRSHSPARPAPRFSASPPLPPPGRLPFAASPHLSLCPPPRLPVAISAPSARLPVAASVPPSGRLRTLRLVDSSAPSASRWLPPRLPVVASAFFPFLSLVGLWQDQEAAGGYCGGAWRRMEEASSAVMCLLVTVDFSEEERLQRLRRRMKVYFDPSRRDHQEALRALWHATYPDQELQGLISEQWKDMGWQGRDPSIDFR
ncbi:hypothetical protein GUJ93_ZPchr0006g44079 [Zizania palustris]|uniref:ELMO domain-containing protein n=1 Tax=Zizania palustris TaxID=103762 RepID=A0A8J5SRE9_ZIZPA|nr:hypothetical protein GUJ93_ZPchr0006g44079 [Zizania palustris]